MAVFLPVLPPMTAAHGPVPGGVAAIVRAYKNGGADTLGDELQSVAAVASSGFSIFGARVGATLRHLEGLDGRLRAASLLQGSRLASGEIDAGGDNLTVIDAAQLLEIYDRALELTGRADLGLSYGEAAGVTEYGPIGYAMLSAVTDLEAVNIALTFQRLYTARWPI